MEGLAELAFRRHHAQIYRYLQRKTGDPYRAEDLAQEVFADATVALSRDGFQPASMAAWLHTIAQRRLADDARRRRRLPLPLPDELLDGWPALEHYDDGEALRAAIAQLGPSQRRIIAMKLLRGYSFAEVASRLGIGEAAAKMRLQRALGALRAELARQGVEP